MQHAQIGFRDPAKTMRAYGEIYEACRKRGVSVDRYGICLDWSMGYPRDRRSDDLRSTGLLLDDVEDFVKLTASAPVAPHFGDFVLGFPAAVETTQAALTAGATSIGNLGQYFTFRLPGWDDDVATTEATVTALGLIAAQDVEILVHSNLDDGFAALFTDLASSLGAVLIEKHIVETLIGGSMSHCYGHHFSDPLRRLAFQIALAQVTETPGTMIYGNTVSYTGGDAENYASLAAYLLADITGQHHTATGHAINPVPVRENDRIPDIEEIIGRPALRRPPGGACGGLRCAVRHEPCRNAGRANRRRRTAVPTLPCCRASPRPVSTRRTPSSSCSRSGGSAASGWKSCSAAADRMPSGRAGACRSSLPRCWRRSSSLPRSAPRGSTRPANRRLKGPVSVSWSPPPTCTSTANW